MDLNYYLLNYYYNWGKKMGLPLPYYECRDLFTVLAKSQSIAMLT